MKLKILENGKLCAMPNVNVKETIKKYNPHVFERFIKQLLSTVYNQFETHPDFEQFIPSVLEEVLQYFTYEDLSIDELAGYFIDQVDVDFDVKLDDDSAYRLAEWAIETFYCMQVGDFSICDEFEQQVEMLKIWQGSDSQIVVKKLQGDQVENTEHAQQQNEEIEKIDQNDEVNGIEEDEEEHEVENDEDFCNYDDGYHEV